MFPLIYYHDITFYKDRMLGVTKRGGILSMEVVKGDESSKIKISKIAPELKVKSSVDRYFAETTDGHLLMVYRYHNNDSYHNSAYEIYKLIIDSNGKLECVPIANLGGESLFLGQRSCGVSVLASNYPGCLPNRIYSGVNCIDGLELDDHHLQVEVFNLEDKSVATSCFPAGCFGSDFPIWLVPTMNL
ncbi:hypothetical protein FNV43_RR00675 [Rhamnella rubrinervis]|uniref:KIB1-4 beta-propeller domain-containing protein n=1 Tax=Rhamnella rubrinervis TaxID=2594499 RepID=A0A8K0HNA2_9ROSA|nr:hypothetical protein FNV43_RR00675 [Rhamnella rubrinervis]